MSAAEAVNWTIALSPVLAMAALFAWLDAFKLMSAWEMLGVLLAGVVAGLAAYPLSGRFLDALPLGFSDYSRFVAPWIEEALKLAAVVALFVFNRIGFKADAASQGFAIGAGFAVVENVIYLTRFEHLAAGVWLVRGLGTAVMHGGTAAIMASFAHEFSERALQQRQASQWRLNPLWFAPGYLTAVAIHAGFNQFPDQPLIAMTGALVFVPIALFVIFYFGTGEAQALLAEDHAEHRAALAALSAGGFPDTDSGRRLAAFAHQHAGGAKAEPIRQYLEVMTWLVLSAETVLMAQAGSDQRVLADDVPTALRRAARLRRELGRPTFRALKPLLPFTRNDQWEISELRERIRRTQG